MTPDSPLMIAVYWLFRKSTPAKMDLYFRKLQLVSAALLSLSHGSNDAQKTMGIVTGAIVCVGSVQRHQGRPLEHRDQHHVGVDSHHLRGVLHRLGGVHHPARRTARVAHS
jgi:phosphate/sulfate permease